MAIVLLIIGLVSIIVGIALYFIWNVKGISNDLSGKSSRKRVEMLKKINSGLSTSISTTNIDLFHDVQGAIDELDRGVGTGEMGLYSNGVVESPQESLYATQTPVEVAPVEPVVQAVREPVAAQVNRMSDADEIDPFSVGVRFNIVQKLTSIGKE